jgi:hypothetical protein
VANNSSLARFGRSCQLGPRDKGCSLEG